MGNDSFNRKQEMQNNQLQIKPFEPHETWVTAIRSKAT